jgi:putative ABC transport system permease protein
MFRNYLVTAVRNLLNQKLYTLINIGGLSIGLAVCLLILLFVRDELSYDDWIPNAEQIFKIELTVPKLDRDPLKMGQVPPAIPPAMERYFPDHIEATTRVLQADSIVGAKDRFFNERISFVDADFFEVFDLEMVAGNRATFATNVSDILISESQARKYFGSTPAPGEVITATINHGAINTDRKAEFRVAGVFKDIPQNSHLPFNMLALIDPLRFEGVNEGFGSAWAAAAYVKFRKGVDPAQVETRLTEFYTNVAPSRADETEEFDYRVSRKFNFINAADVYLYSDKTQQLKPIGDITTVISFTVAAVFILIIGAINFMNLATARALRRAKEVSMRKVLGASRRQLVRQFLGEAVLTAIFALLVALVMVEMVLPFYNEYLNKSMGLELLADPLQSAIIILATVLVGVLGGMYPAFFLSSYRPSHVMGSSSSPNKGSPLIRQALVVFQFAISVALIVATVIVHEQTALLRGMDLGVDLDSRLVVTGISANDVAPMGETIRHEFLAVDGVTYAALSTDELPLVYYNNIDIEIPSLGITEPIDTDRVFVDTHFFEVYGVKALAGRLYSEEFTTDTLAIPDQAGVPWTRNAVVTQSFVKSAGLADPNQLIGEWFLVPDYGGEGIDLHATVVGVVPDLHLRALKERTAQLVFFASSSILDVMTLKIESNDVSATLADIDRAWQKIVPEVPINRYFVDDKFSALYHAEERRGQVFSAFAVFAIFVACLGLFGLAAYSVEQKTLEIGIRKVHGARIADILALIGAQLLKSVLWANVIAWPVVYFIMRGWLDSYAFRIDITPWVFITSGLLAALLALACVAWQVLKVARSSPVHALRYE